MDVLIEYFLPNIRPPFSSAPPTSTVFSKILLCPNINSITLNSAHTGTIS